MGFNKVDDAAYIAINNAGVVVDFCPMDSDPIGWMQKYPDHRLLITETVSAQQLVGHEIPTENNQRWQKV